MPKILVLGKQSQFRTLLSESLWFEGHRVDSVGDAAMLWEHLGNTQPDLVLLDATLDGFGAMRLYQDLKQQFPDLGVIVYQCRNYGDVDRIKGAVSDALIKPRLNGSSCDESSEDGPSVVSSGSNDSTETSSTFRVEKTKIG